MVLLDFNILHFSSNAIIVVVLMALCLAALYCLSLQRSGVSLLSETDAKALHNHKTWREQRLYTFYQRKDKVKASVSTAEIIVSVVFVMLAMSLIRSSHNALSLYTGIMDFGENCAFQYICTFIIIAFVLVATIQIPSRIYTDAQKERFLLRTSGLVSFVYSITSPITFVNAYSKKDSEADSAQISVAIDAKHTKMGEKQILQNILQFGDTEVKEIMTPRHDIVAVGNSESFSSLKKIIVESNFSRIPVFENNPDSIFGIVYVKDLLKFVSRGDEFDWRRLIRKINYVSENKKISDLLKVFQQKKIHMAAVSDEYGGISGLITMQDILEEIVGEINDEFDENEELMFKKIDDTFYIFDGKITLGDFCKVMKLDDDFFDEVKGDAESIAGVILEMRGEFPKLGEKINFKDFTFSIEAFDTRRIQKVGVKIN